MDGVKFSAGGVSWKLTATRTPHKNKRILHLSVYLAATRVSHRVAQQKANPTGFSGHAAIKYPSNSQPRETIGKGCRDGGIGGHPIK